MNSALRRVLILCTLTGAGGVVPAALAQQPPPLVISTEERCAFNRVDDDSMALALENCLELAEAEDMQAQFEMGELYYHGERTERDLETALKWYERASIQGQPDAQYRLGLMHMNGEGVERNLPQAYIMLKMAAVNGQDAAMDASDLLAEEMSPEEIAAATQVLGTLFRNYLRHIREEQLRQLQPENPPPSPPTPLPQGERGDSAPAL
ncbi:tetratricopeptide repeat protein [Halopseudomonas xiamenensis]|uniref:tetratricopeptide repeat protein n=1 Tax=Halopseudomonas xiamenensis TaxID=157792 RepID=UPI0016257115|nr:tetratricopeptide repeat protein [Halopseudomonas xiamenensis]